MTREQIVAVLHDARREGAKAAEDGVDDRWQEGMTLGEVSAMLDLFSGRESLADCCQLPRGLSDEMDQAYTDVWCAAVRARTVSLRAELQAMVEALKEVSP